MGLGPGRGLQELAVPCRCLALGGHRLSFSAQGGVRDEVIRG